MNWMFARKLFLKRYLIVFTFSQLFLFLHYGADYRPGEKPGRYDYPSSEPYDLDQSLINLQHSLIQLSQILHSEPETYQEFPETPSRINLNYMKLWDDIQHYKTTNGRWHAGDVYQHSMWSGLCIEKWFDEKKFWVEGLGEHDKQLLIIAGILHDIGKSGDGKFVFFTKPQHPKVGFDYLIGKSFYRTKNNTIFDFNSYLNHFEFNDGQKAIIAVLVGIHYDFGLQVIARITYTKNPNKNIFKNYLNKLKNLVSKTKYPDIFNRALVIMSMVVSAADVRAAQPVYYSSTLFNIPSQILPVHKGGTKYEQLKFDTKGKIIRDALLAYYDEHYQKN